MLRIHSLGVATLVALMDADRDGDAARPAPAGRHDGRGSAPHDAELTGADRRPLVHAGFSDG
ncbi:MAG: hypothetical protein J0I21_08305 [Alphaproteobacteria bacterium]|nr:hypothetical protein [Alphaproteobacteria bacterium]